MQYFSRALMAHEKQALTSEMAEIIQDASSSQTSGFHVESEDYGRVTGVELEQVETQRRAGRCAQLPIARNAPDVIVA